MQVRDVQDLSRDIAEYNPGPSYWDIMAFDVYNKSGFTKEKYKDVLKVAGDKLIAIGECDHLPEPDVLNAQPRWVFFMGWASLIHEKNTPEQIRATYDSPRVVTLDKMPGWIKKN